MKPALRVVSLPRVGDLEDLELLAVGSGFVEFEDVLVVADEARDASAVAFHAGPGIAVTPDEGDDTAVFIAGAEIRRNGRAHRVDPGRGAL